MEEKKGYKMYSIVLRQLDGQNKGVQTTHCVCEYVRKHWDDEDLQQWINQDKTLVMLSGGTVPDMNEIRACFDEVGIPYETFEEEDLAGITTSICLLADEKVWDRKNYPSFNEFAKTYTETTGFTNTDDLIVVYERLVGGHQNAVKKEILNNLRLA